MPPISSKDGYDAVPLVSHQIYKQAKYLHFFIYIPTLPSHSDAIISSFARGRGQYKNRALRGVNIRQLRNISYLKDPPFLYKILDRKSAIMTIDVSDLASQIDGTVLTPGDADYDESIKRWASNAERKAAVVVLVTSSADIATVVNPLSQSEV